MGLRTGVSYFGNRTLRYVEQDMKEIAACGFDYVVHCFTESDLLWGLESMREIVNISHAAGLEVHLDPWGVAGVFGGEALSKFVTWNTDANQVLADGSQVAVTCLNHPKLLPFLYEWIDAGIDIGADLLFFDEPHWYPGDLWYIGKSVGKPEDRWSCRCSVCLARYQDETGNAMPLRRNAQVQQFRSDAVLRLTTALISYAKSRGATTDLCLLPHGITFDLVGVPDWEPFGDIPGLDYFGTDPYWRAGEIVPLEPYVRPNAAAVRALCDKHQLRDQYWVQGYGFPRGTEDEIARAVDIAIEEGMTDIAIWAFRACEPMSRLWSDDIDRTWSVVTESLARHR
ncbi:MAG: hypothetical protein R2839_05075 [Thermomicrobiales bacterium]